MEYDVIVVGGGAAGLHGGGDLCQGRPSHAGARAKRAPARKVMITGKGRCNVTNDCDAQDFIKSVPVNGRFLYSAVANFTPQDTMLFFESEGLPLKTERGNRVFPKSDRAVDVVGYADPVRDQNGGRSGRAGPRSCCLTGSASAGCRPRRREALCGRGTCEHGWPVLPGDPVPPASAISGKTGGAHGYEAKPSLVPLVAKKSGAERPKALR